MTTDRIPLEDLLDAVWRTAGWSCPDLSRVAPGPDRIRAVAGSGFCGLGIPHDLGGSGLGMLELAGAQRAIAMQDPSAAIALNMHSHTVSILTEYWLENRDYSWFLLEGIAESQSLLASAFAETAGSANLLRADATATQLERGFLLSGRKFPCSLVTTARLYCVSARLEGSNDTVVALVPAGSSGLGVETDAWAAVGMRNSDTGALRLDDVEVDDRLVFFQGPPEDLHPIVVAGVVAFAVLTAATYHGVLTSLLRSTVLGLQSRDAQIEASVGAAARELIVLQFAIAALAEAWDREAIRGAGALAAAMALRAALSEGRDRVVHAITPMAGSRIFSHGHPIASLALDSLAVHHHPPSLRLCDRSTGAFAWRGAVMLDLPDSAPPSGETEVPTPDQAG